MVDHASATPNALQTDIDDFNAYLLKLDPTRVPAGSIGHVYIPESVYPLKTKGADVGVSGDLINEGTSGLPVVIPAYSNMQVDDVIKVYWDDDQVWTHKVRSGQQGQPLTLNIPADDIPAGITELYFSVTAPSASVEEQSVRLSVLVRLNYPGEDPNLDDQLAPATVSHAKIDLNSKNVQVTVPAYAKMRRYDRIQLSWSGHILEHEVTSRQVGKAITIDIPDSVVDGSSDASVEISYYVIDEVGNESDDWSPNTLITNDLAKGLPAPHVVDPQTLQSVSRLQPGSPGAAGLSVEIDPPAGGFKVGDQIHVLWTGEDAQGVRSVVDLGTQVVVRGTRTLIFDLPVRHLQPLWGGQGIASYECYRGAKVEYSKRTRVKFVGAALKLPPPKLNGVSQGYIEADLDPVIVVVPAAAKLQANDVVTLTWRGVRPDSTLLLEKPAPLRISTAQAGQDAVFRLNGSKLLLPLDGGTLDVSYTVTRGKAQVLSESALLDVGETLETLVAPTLDPDPANGVLDPTLADYDLGVDLVVPLPSSISAPYTVEIEWSTSSGGVYIDTQDVPAAGGTSIKFQIPRAQLDPGLTQTQNVTVYYRIMRPGQIDLVSFDLELVLGKQPQHDLPLPLVNEVQQDVLDPSALTLAATVTIPAAAGLAAGDKVVVYWNGDQPNSVIEVHDSVARGEEGAARTVPIDLRYVLASENGEVDVQYEIIRFADKRPSDWSGLIKFRVQRGPLPDAVIVEALQGNINPFDLNGQATVVIAAAAKLEIGDEVLVDIEGLQGGQVNTITHTVQAGEQGLALHVPVASAIIVAHMDHGLKLSYRIKRFADGRVEQSPEQLYSVNQVVSAGPLRVMGARFNVDGRAEITPPRRLTAVHGVTSSPIIAEWRYRGDATWTPAQTWHDTQPERLLEVRTSAQQVVLNVPNVLGNDKGFTALTDTPVPGAYGLKSWGSIAAAPALDDVVDLSVNSLAMAARRSNGAITCWGHSGFGSIMRPEDVARRDFLKVRSNYNAFVALYGTNTGDRHLTGWGTSTSGGQIPQYILDLRDVDEIVATWYAFAALRSKGGVVAWGHSTYGGVMPPDLQILDDVVEVKGSAETFIGRRVTTDGRKKVFVWGNLRYVGNLPVAIAQRDDIESIEAHTFGAHCLLTSQRKVLAFGSAVYGGSVPVEIERLTDVVEVTATISAFCARRSNGHIVAWGDSGGGGNLPADIAKRPDVMQVSATGGAFAALFADGSVKCWGNASYGGNADALAGQLINVRAIYANQWAFTALTQDGRVLTWGNTQCGGYSLSAQADLVQKVRAQRI
ncbi:hypothetical protein IRZ53_20775 [Pseudomonas fulva]|uniref:RCC1 domain-containing protein n=1 Tax=Pseudomonas fulva TaxID=47880 RepID=UPI0018AA6C05|nr:hypothetical protein [Pseudomonas fulva]MBF8676858.1 hypothetical protein [Pseudomonas fulva]MBF8699221.1 hypothetical protein [Pseudomonas fulva]